MATSACAAADLADLLDRRNGLHNTSGFSTETYYHVCDVLDAAAADNPFYRSHLAERLDDLRCQFDLKYWPPLGAIVREVSIDAAKVTESAPAAIDQVTAAATRSRRGSLADFFRALQIALEKVTAPGGRHLPRGFSLSDSATAALANCLLDLPPDEMVGAPYVKRWRQRDREAQARE